MLFCLAVSHLGTARQPLPYPPKVSPDLSPPVCPWATALPLCLLFGNEVLFFLLVCSLSNPLSQYFLCFYIPFNKSPLPVYINSSQSTLCLVPNLWATVFDHLCPVQIPSSPHPMNYFISFKSTYVLIIKSPGSRYCTFWSTLLSNLLWDLLLATQHSPLKATTVFPV